MTDGFAKPGDVPEYFLSAHNSVFKIDSSFSRIIELSETIINRDPKIADQQLMEIFKYSVKLQNILLTHGELKQRMIIEYGDDFFEKLEDKTDIVYHLCQYLSKMHDIKAHGDIFATNNILIFLTLLLAYDAIVKFDGGLIILGSTIRYDIIIGAVLYVIAFWLNSRRSKPDFDTEGQINTSS